MTSISDDMAVDSGDQSVREVGHLIPQCSLAWILPFGTVIELGDPTILASVLSATFGFLLAKYIRQRWLCAVLGIALGFIATSIIAAFDADLKRGWVAVTGSLLTLFYDTDEEVVGFILLFGAVVPVVAAYFAAMVRKTSLCSEGRSTMQDAVVVAAGILIACAIVLFN